MLERKSRYEVLLDVFSLIFGTFLFLTPWMGGLSGAGAEDKIGVIDAWAGGGLIAAAASVSIVKFSVIATWVNFAAGQWAAVAPWLLGFAMHSAARWEHAAAGLSVAALAAFQLCLAEHHALAAGKGIDVTGKRPGRSLGEPRTPSAVERRKSAAPEVAQRGTVVPFPPARLRAGKHVAGRNGAGGTVRGPGAGRPTDAA
jgi:hypothetical protein